jgi:hypothetical protein
MGKAIRFALVGLMAATLLSAAPAAMAGSGDIVKEGRCSQASDWKLKVGPEDRKLEVEFEVDSNVVGQTWNVVIKQNGVRIFKGQAVTQAPSGSFEVRKRTIDNPGTDSFKAKAFNPDTGELCKASLDF